MELRAAPEEAPFHAGQPLETKRLFHPRLRPYPGSDSEGLSPLHDPHVPHSLELTTYQVILYKRQQIFCCLQEYRADTGRALSEAGEVVLHYHTEHLVAEAPGLTWLHIRVLVGHSQGGHIVAGLRLLSCMLVELLY